jgi:hypothetical protein
MRWVMATMNSQQVEAESIGPRWEGERARSLLRETVASADAFEADRAALTLLAVSAGRQAVGVDAAEAARAAVHVEDALLGRWRGIFDARAREADLTECALGTGGGAGRRAGSVYTLAAGRTLRVCGAQRARNAAGSGIGRTAATGHTAFTAFAGRAVFAGIHALGEVADPVGSADGIAVTGGDGARGRRIRGLGRVARDRIAVFAETGVTAALIAVAALSLCRIFFTARQRG